MSAILNGFIMANHDELSARARARVSLRKVSHGMQAERDRFVPDLLMQIAALLTGPMAHGPDAAARKQTFHAAARERYHLHRWPYNCTRCPRLDLDKSDVCEVVTEFAVERSEPLQNDELLALHRCLADAIASAVTAYAEIRESAIREEGAARSGVLAHELRNALLVPSAELTGVRNRLRRGYASPVRDIFIRRIDGGSVSAVEPSRSDAFELEVHAWVVPSKVCRTPGGGRATASGPFTHPLQARIARDHLVVSPFASATPTLALPYAQSPHGPFGSGPACSRG